MALLGHLVLTYTVKTHYKRTRIYLQDKITEEEKNRFLTYGHVMWKKKTKTQPNEIINYGRFESSLKRKWAISFEYLCFFFVFIFRAYSIKTKVLSIMANYYVSSQKRI